MNKGESNADITDRCPSRVNANDNDKSRQEQSLRLE